MSDTTIPILAIGSTPEIAPQPADVMILVPPRPIALEPRTAASLGFLWRYLMRSKAPLSNHYAILERLRAELAWATAEWRRLNPYWSGWDHEAELAAAAERLPHEQAAATALNAWGHVVGHRARIAECRARLKSQRRAGWHAHAIDTADDLRAHWQNRRLAWRVFLQALRRYRELRAAVDPSPNPPMCVKEAA